MQEPKKQSYLQGAAVLAATVVITKIIGFIYKIPLYNLLGDVGTAHFQVTYTIYTLLLTLSTAGVPVALSRLIAEARATGRPMQAKRIFNVAMGFFGFIGAVGTGIMLIWNKELGVFMGDPEIALGVMVLAPSVFFVCIVSVLRGYAQGHNDMLPTSISQITEVLSKMVFGLIIAFWLVKMGADDATVSAGSIIGVTIGVAISVPLMLYYKTKISKRYAENLELDVPKGVWGTLADVVKVCVPIMLGSSMLNIINLIDTKLVLNRLQSGAMLTSLEAETLYGAYSKGMTLYNLPSSLITPVAVSVVPIIAASLARHDGQEAKKNVESCIKLTNIFALPAAVGLCVLAEPIYTTLFPVSHPIGSQLLSMLGIASYFVCAYLVTNAVLQATGHEKLGLIALPLGGIIKIIVNWVLVGNPGINIIGAPIGTICCYLFITALNIVFILLKLPEKPDFIKITLRPVLCSLAMGAAAWGVNGLMSRFVLPLLGGRMIGKVLCLGVTIAAAVAVYAALTLLTRVITKEDVILLPK
ncbi:MAG: polysaccharide biosynthesis protein, partial [Oscillospiraceae bacterium]|nr:polysaccharide biosynthesis protein [Oscillospiraceae bacterium]